MPLPDYSHITQSTTAKLIVIVMLTCVLFVPLMMVWALINERADRRNDVVREVGAVWGSRQTVGSFTMSIPFDTVTTVNGVATRVLRHAVVLPQVVSIDADLAPEVRRRSIFAVNLYRVTLRVTGAFVPPDFAKLGVTPDTVYWQQAVFDAAISDLRGAVSVTPLTWAGQALTLEPAMGDGPFGGGLRAIAPLAGSGTTPFSVEFVVAGSDGLMFMPSGASTRVALRSPWPSPGFTGNMLPFSYEIGDGGFRAEWNANHLARPLPQTWIAEAMERAALADKSAASAFGVTLVTTVDHYQQTERAVKYGVLFVGLTFALFFLWEVIEGLRLHPIQYLLVGLALVVFYLLLLSLTEHVRFALAYGLASAATVVLVSGYASRILGAGRRGAAVAVWMSALYGLLFVLLGLEDLALLVGSVVVFAALAAMMYFTRNIDWYRIGRAS